MSNESQFTHNDKPVRVINKPLIFLNSIAITLSFFAMICLPLFPFAVWWHGGLPGEIHLTVVIDFKLYFGSSYWFSIASLFLFLTFLLSSVMSIVLLLHSIGKISLRFPPNKIGMLGFIPSYAALTLTVTLTIVFIQYSIDRLWHLSFSLYILNISNLI